MTRRATPVEFSLSYPFRLNDLCPARTAGRLHLEGQGAGAAHEFGCKVSIATNLDVGFIVGMRSFPGNSYDGHTLGPALEQVEILTDHRSNLAVVDRGYRGHDVERTRVLIRGTRRGLTPKPIADLRRRSAIVAEIGHMKIPRSALRLRHLVVLLHKSGDKRTSPFSGQSHPAASVNGMPSAVQPFRMTTRPGTRRPDGRSPAPVADPAV